MLRVDRRAVASSIRARGARMMLDHGDADCKRRKVVLSGSFLRFPRPLRIFVLGEERLIQFRWEGAMKRPVLNLLGLLLVTLVLVVLLVPELRSSLVGRVRGEPFLDGMPVSYWISRLDNHDV